MGKDARAVDDGKKKLLFFEGSGEFLAEFLVHFARVSQRVPQHLFRLGCAFRTDVDYGVGGQRVGYVVAGLIHVFLLQDSFLHEVAQRVADSFNFDLQLV